MESAHLDIIGRSLQFIGWAFTPMFFLPLIVLALGKLIPLAEGVAQIIEGGVEKTGEIIKWVMPLMVISIAFSVFALSIYGLTSVWWDEASIYLHALGICLGVAPTYLAGKHVKVDIFFDKFSSKGRALVEFCGFYLFLLPVCLACVWYSQSFVNFAWRSLEGSTNGDGIQGIFILKTGVSVMFLMLILQGLAMALRAALVLIDSELKPLSSQASYPFLKSDETGQPLQ